MRDVTTRPFDLAAGGGRVPDPLKFRQFGFTRRRLRGVWIYVRNRAGLAGALCAGGMGLPHSKTTRTGAGTEGCFSLASETTGVSGLAERYAAALFDLADERRMLDEVAANLRQLRAMVEASGDFLRLIRSPVLSRGEQAKAIGVLAERAELSSLVRNFLAVIARNRRLFAVPAIIEAFLHKLATRRGEVDAQVTTAQPLSEAQLAALNEHLRRSIGSRVSVNVRVDPGLIGGIIVKVGSRMVDGSVESKLQRLQLAMKSVA
jgi:F-type H+-transporting ATPase subunit delta